MTIHAWSLSVSEVTYEKVTAFLPQLLSKLYIEGLVYGNITKQVGDDLHVTTGNLELLGKGLSPFCFGSYVDIKQSFQQSADISLLFCGMVSICC